MPKNGTRQENLPTNIIFRKIRVQYKRKLQTEKTSYADFTGNPFFCRGIMQRCKINSKKVDSGYLEMFSIFFKMLIQPENVLDNFGKMRYNNMVYIFGQ